MMRNEEKLNLEAESRRLPVDLGDGLLMRWAVPEDAEELGAFNVRIHTDNPDEIEAWLDDWTKDLMSGRHPTTGAGDFTVVVDRQAGDKIVSSLNLISQTWAYDGIPFAVGRVELVGSDPDYRRRGLIRRQMTAVHDKSAVRGELVQSITGIPWYYRLFGYEMALNLGGGRLYFWNRPGNNKPVTEEVYRLRPAVETDIPVLEKLYVAHSADSLVVHQRSREIWTYELFTAHRETPAGQNISMVEDSTGQVVAYVEIDPHGTSLAVREMGVGKGYSWRAIALFLVRELKRRADKINLERKKQITSINFRLGESHPVYDALGSQLEKGQKPYAWYIRIPDLPRFLRHVTPAIERRLAESVMAGHSGTLRLNFYRSTLTLLFDKGKLREIGTYEPGHIEDADALFPDLTFLQLLFGYRSYEELDFAFADCYAVNAEAAVLLNCLFPRRPSDINPLN
jgi:predicted acetyltransferase